MTTQAPIREQLRRVTEDRDSLTAQNERLRAQLATASADAAKATSALALKRRQLLTAGLVDVGELLDVEHHEKHGSKWATISVSDADIIDAIRRRRAHEATKLAFRTGLIHPTDMPAGYVDGGFDFSKFLNVPSSPKLGGYVVDPR